MTEEKKEDKKVAAPKGGEPRPEKTGREEETKPKTEEVIDVPKKFKKLIEGIEEMSVIDLAELVKILEKKFGVSAVAPVTAVAPATDIAPVSTSAEKAPVEEKSVFNIELTAVGDKKIEVIKLVRDTTQKGLKEAKDVVDAAATSSQIIKENVKKEEAEELKKQFEAVGAKVELS